MRHLVRTTKALADETRIRILGALQGRELCVSADRTARPCTFDSFQTSVHSQNARLIDSRKEGRWMYYRLSGEDAPGQITAAVEWVFRSLVDSPQYTQDNLRLEEILKIDPEILGSRQPRPAA